MPNNTSIASTKQTGAEMSAQHTALPWHAEETEDGIWTIRAPGEPPIISFQLAKLSGRNLPNMEANAAFIVRACNAHDDLVRALRNLSWLQPGDQIGSSDVESIRAALAKAGAA
jgi:hypothetical protein